jgi:hypothetical protein
MASLMVRNIPEDAKLRFRQIAAAHGRSMEEHLRQMIIEADLDDTAHPTGRVSDVSVPFRHQQSGEDIVHELIKAANGAGDDFLDRHKYAEIRFMSAKDALAELRRLAGGVGFNAPRRMNTNLEAPEF